MVSPRKRQLRLACVRRHLTAGRAGYPIPVSAIFLNGNFHILTENLTESSLVADQRKRYLTIGASDVLNYYGTDKPFRNGCDPDLSAGKAVWKDISESSKKNDLSIRR